MKFIISFLFGVFLVAPVFATITENCPTTAPEGTSLSVYCKQTPGCKWDAPECVRCGSGTYNNGTFTDGCHSCNEQHNWPTPTTGKIHPKGASSCDDWICDADNGYHLDPSDANQCTNAQDCSSYNKPDHSEFDTDCTWYCIEDYYKEGSTCTACPFGSNTRGATHIESINYCSCVDGTHKYPNANNWTHCVTYSGDVNTNATGCATGAQATLSGSGDNWTVTCTCDSHASNQNGQCECNDRYATTVTDGVVYCTPCGTGEITQNGNCICDERHYGSHADGCTACPSGTKVATLGTTTTKANCRAHSDTKFCNADGQNCMKLLQ